MINNIIENARKQHAIKQWRKRFLPWQLRNDPEPSPLKEFIENEKNRNWRFTGR